MSAMQLLQTQTGGLEYRRKGLNSNWSFLMLIPETAKILKPQQFKSASKKFHLVMGKEKLTTVRGEKVASVQFIMAVCLLI